MKKPVVILLHAGYWLIYLLLLGVISLVVFAGMGSGMQANFLSPGFIAFMSVFSVLPAVIGFYTFYAYLFGRFLKQKKIALLFMLGLLVSVCAGVISLSALCLVLPDLSIPSDGIFITSVTGIVSLLNGGMGLVIKGFITWYADIKIKDELDKKNYEMELALVKSQINPHFLFNTLNNIDVLIEMDAPRASAYLNKLSDIMRFMLYETKTNKIPLSRELEYIEKYIDLQKIRNANADYVRYIVKGQPANYIIEPMLLIPFIENAFKHAEQSKIQHAIDIAIAVENGTILFTCANAYRANAHAKTEYSGLGNELIEKRIRLLYPGRHQLQIVKSETTYTVNLCLYEH